MDLFSANQLMWTAFLVGNSAPLLFISFYKSGIISKELFKIPSKLSSA